MKRLAKLLSLVFLVLATMPHLLRAQEEIGLKMDVDKRQLELGDTLVLTLDFKQVGTTNSAVVQEPSIPSSENFEITSQFSGTRIQQVGRAMAVISTTTYHLTATKVGTAQLGPASLIYRDAEGKNRDGDRYGKERFFFLWKKEGKSRAASCRGSCAARTG
jgi:hypothetical protein